jgi:hypothetical protein
MAKLSDKQKADAILGDVEEETPVEPTNENQTDLEPEEQEATNESETVEEPVEESPEEEKPTEEEAEAEPEADTFTKQFPNLKGDTLPEYKEQLETAYDNSFKEALRLNKALEEANATITALRSQAPIQPQVQPGAGQQPATPQLPTAPLQDAINELPEIQRIKAQDTQSMFSAFDDFAKAYPQAREQQPFDDFTKVSDGVSRALTARLGRIPTYPELFTAIAGTLQWQPTTPTPTKDAAIKNAGASSHTNSQTLPPARRSKVSDQQVEAYMKMYTSKTREEAVKELSEVV